MAKSSIHIVPIKSGSRAHNTRKTKLGYVREELTKNNWSGYSRNPFYDKKSLGQIKEDLKVLVKEKTGRAMQEKATPLREAVFNFEERHTNEEISKAITSVAKKFGIKGVELHIHRDEGHEVPNTGEWIPNYHAHVIFDFIDHNTGKSVKLGRQDMSDMQTALAEALGMERGEPSQKTHLDALEFKKQKLAEEVAYEREQLKNLKHEQSFFTYLIRDTDYLEFINDKRSKFDDLIQERNERQNERKSRDNGIEM